MKSFRGSCDEGYGVTIGIGRAQVSRLPVDQAHVAATALALDDIHGAILLFKTEQAGKRQIQEMAIRAFQSVECSGLARVDFLMDPVTGHFYLNEVNTMPGFTAISMYPKMWEAAGLSFSGLLDRLITLAIQRHSEMSARRTSFSPSNDWYRS